MSAITLPCTVALSLRDADCPCPQNLAWHEMRLLLVTTLLHFDLSLTEQSKQWSDQQIYTLWEKKPLMCTLVPAKA